MRASVPEGHRADAWLAPLRLLLLAVVAAGVIQMHVFEHAGVEHGGSAGVLSMPAHVAAVHIAELEHAVRTPAAGVDGRQVLLVAGVEQAPGPESAAGPELAPGSGRRGLSLELLAVCLAVMTSVAAAAVLVILFTRWPGAAVGGADGRLERALAGRGPPGWGVPLGRRVAIGSVLRI